MVEDERELTKEGLCRLDLVQNQRTAALEGRNQAVERISTPKIEEYFKNINPEFAEALRK